MTRKLLGFQVETDPRVYRPAEDSLLLAEAVDPPQAGPALDVCTGSGLVALALAEVGGRTVATDVNPRACRLARRNARANASPVDAVCTDLAAGLEGEFAAVACNPPYLPTDEAQRVPGPANRALDGGPDGARVTRRFLEALPELLAEAGRAWLLVSSLQPVDELADRARSLGLSWNRVRGASVGRFERLSVVELAHGG